MTPEEAAADEDLLEATSAKVPHALDLLGLGAVLVPFVFSLRSSSSTSFTTTMVGADGVPHATTSGHAQFKDVVAIGGGALGLVMAVATVALWRKTAPTKRSQRIGLTAGILALGIFQLVVRGGLLT